MELREATREDIEDILEMYRGVNEDTSLTDSLSYCLTRNIGEDRMMLAVVDERPVGFLWSRLLTDPETGAKRDEIKLIIIADDMYGKGIGGLLLEAEKDFAALNQADIMNIANKQFSDNRIS
jgi:GNAT superfamily N-acetyltransferase